MGQDQVLDACRAFYLRASASLPLTVGHEAGEERQVDAVVQGQQEVSRQLEVGGELGQQLPHTVQEEQENRSLRGRREEAERPRR